MAKVTKLPPPPSEHPGRPNLKLVWSRPARRPIPDDVLLQVCREMRLPKRRLRLIEHTGRDRGIVTVDLELMGMTLEEYYAEE